MRQAPAVWAFTSTSSHTKPTEFHLPSSQNDGGARRRWRTRNKTELCLAALGKPATEHFLASAAHLYGTGEHLRKILLLRFSALNTSRSSMLSGA
jgi:hypothetical protein